MAGTEKTRSWIAVQPLRFLGLACLIGVAACGGTASARLAERGGSQPATIRSFDGMPALACGGIGPLSLLTATPGAENADTPEVRGLRHLFAHDPTGGESPQTPHHWVLMAEHGDQVTFGQRTGRLGIGAIVTLERHADGYRFVGSGGCGPVGYDDGQKTIALDGYSGDGDHLTVDYTGGTCSSTAPSLKVVETRSDVDLLLVSPRPPSGSSSNEVCAQVGTNAHLVVTLSSPVGSRTVQDISYLPARVLRSENP